MQKKIFFVVSLIAVVFGGLFILERYLKTKPIEIVQTGKVLPDISVLNLKTDKAESLTSFKGKVLLINFWASWCEACMEEMPSIVELHNKLAPEGFEVLAINVDDDPKKVVPKMIEKFKMPFGVYADNEEKLAGVFNVVAIPYTIIVDKQLNVVWTESGERNWASKEIIEKIQSLLKQSS